MKRFSAHRGKLFSLLPSGMALRHNASPVACLKIEQMYARPVLLSGLGGLVLRQNEINALHIHYKDTLRNILKLPKDVAEPAVFFIAGSLPIVAYLHMRILSLFSMICHLQGNPLNYIAREAIVRARPSSRSWFLMLRDICVKYDLPHPLILLESPMPKNKFKTLYKLKVTEVWHSHLVESCKSFPSLRYLCPEFLSLSRPHPIFAFIRGNAYELRAAYLQALLLCGRFRTERIKRHWTDNKLGICLSPICNNLKLLDTQEHFLLYCHGLSDERRRLLNFTLAYSLDKPVFKLLLNECFFTTDDGLRLQFLIDPSILPMVVSTVQVFGDIILQNCFKIGRVWCRTLNDARLRKVNQFRK